MMYALPVTKRISPKFDDVSLTSMKFKFVNFSIWSKAELTICLAVEVKGVKSDELCPDFNR